MSNDNMYIKYYNQYNISPVHQNIDNFDEHVKKREKLYRKLGLSIMSFHGKDLLEVGPGSGYNSLVFTEWGSRVDLVEPNLKGYNEINELFSKFNIEPTKYNLSNCTIEDYKVNKTYDIIIAEGFIQFIRNRKEIISILSTYVKKGGVVVLTCTDEISFFFEVLRKILASRLCEILEIEDFNEKIEVLKYAYDRHFKSLKYSSRPIEDWIIDNIISTEKFGDCLNMADAINLFNSDFDILGMTPQLVTDYSWYKDFEYDEKKNFMNQFYKKNHNLIMVGLDETIWTEEDDKFLAISANKIRMIVENNNNKIDRDIKNEIVIILNSLNETLKKIDIDVFNAVNEFVNLLGDENLSKEKINNCEFFYKAFGRGQQYVSMVKKWTPTVE